MSDLRQNPLAAFFDSPWIYSSPDRQWAVFYATPQSPTTRSVEGGKQHFWSVYAGNDAVGHATRCTYSPQLKKNIALWCSRPKRVRHFSCATGHGRESYT
jgi:hypothetical protein